MGIKQQWIALYTVARRELVRMFRIASQVFLPPVITTLLYFLIFGRVVGDRLGIVNSVPYATFIAPGLIMMSVIINSYANVSTSLFSVRFQKNIEEMLVSPMHDSVLLWGFIIGGIVRGIGVALLVFIVAAFFITFHYDHIFLSLLVIVAVSAVFSLAGFINGMLARNFDEVALIPTFVLTPLTYLGGVFYAVSMLPQMWQQVSYFNPIFYMVSALRYAMLDDAEVSIYLSMSVTLALLIIFLGLSMWLLRRGTGLRD